MKKSLILTTPPQKEYELLDSGEGEKLERYGPFILSRPDPQALWEKRLTQKDWLKADGIFTRSGTTGIWKIKSGIPDRWSITFGGLTFFIKPTPFKHTGLFPEQLPNWQWMQELIKKSGRNASVLNLFGYTGGATVACAASGAEVCHLDGSRAALDWAHENANASGIADNKIRWIPDDARMFVKREIKRGKKYDGIILDPPSFGRGPKGEVWKIERDFLKLIKLCRDLLSDKPLFFVINGYAAGYSALAYENALNDVLGARSGVIETGELAIEESAVSNKNTRLLPAGIMTRWTSL